MHLCSFLFPLHSSHAISLWLSGSIISDNTTKPFLFCLFCGIKSPKINDDLTSSVIQSGPIVKTEDWFSPLSNKTPELLKCRVMRKGSQHFCEEIIIYNKKSWHSQFYPLVPVPTNTVYRKNGAIILLWFRTYHLHYEVVSDNCDITKTFYHSV